MGFPGSCGRRSRKPAISRESERVSLSGRDGEAPCLIRTRLISNQATDWPLRVSPPLLWETQGWTDTSQATLQSHYSCCSVAHSCPTPCDPMDCSTPDFPVFHHLPELAQTMSIESVIPSNHLILCRPLLLQPSFFPASHRII